MKDVRTTTIQVISRIPQEEVDWQFKEGWNTIGALLAHINAIEHYFRIVFVEGRKLTSDEENRLLPGLDMGPYLPQLRQNLNIETYIARLTESRRLLLDALNGLSFEEFTKKIDAYDPDTGSDLAWILFHMAEDEIYHRGQISMLRKLYKDHAGQGY